MFCQYCGQPMAGDAHFCPECGRKAVTPPQASEGAAVLPYATGPGSTFAADSPVITVRPVFLGWPSLVRAIPLTVFMTIWAGGFCGGFSTVGLKAFHLRAGHSLFLVSPFFFWGTVAFFGIPLVGYIRKRLNTTRTEYRFYRDRLEVYIGGLAIEKQTIAYRSITQTDLKMGLIQQRYGLGSIVLNTQSYDSTMKRMNNVQIVDVPNPESLYEELKKLIAAAVPAI